MDTNSIVLFGRLTADAQVSMTSPDRGIANFRIAQNYKTKVNGEYIEKVNYFGCATPFISIAKYLTKGTPVVVSGRINQETYTGNDGLEHTTYKVFATEVQLLPYQRQQGDVGAIQATIQQPMQPVNIEAVQAKPIEQSPYAMADPNAVPF